MPYKIHYTSSAHPVTRWPRWRRWVLRLLFFTLFAAAAWQIVPDELIALRQIILPLDVEQMVEELLDGNGIAQAVTTFCQEIFHGQ